MSDFCQYCGAGIGSKRREGEGTCHHCDVEVANKVILSLDDRLLKLANELAAARVKVINQEAIIQDLEDELADSNH